MICSVTDAVCHGEILAVSSVCWARLSLAASVMAVSIPVSWSRAASVQIMMTQAAISSVVGLWSGPVSSFLIFPVVPQARSGMVTFVCLVMCCWCSGQSYFVWADHDDMTVFIAFIAPHVRTVSCNVSWSLTLKTAILFVWHHIDCWGWDDQCSELLCSNEFFHFQDGVHKCLRSFFIDACC